MESSKQENSGKEPYAGEQFEPIIEAWRAQLAKEYNAAIDRLKFDLMRTFAETQHKKDESAGSRQM